MTITVNKPEKINVAEGQKVEFKTSAFYAPGEQNPCIRQMRTIAETVAAFMNAEGGTLYIGVADNGTIYGIGGDLDVLGFLASSVALKMPKMNDSEYEYKATTDHYQLKLQHILQAFLSPNHAKYIESIGFGRLTKTSKELCCRIAVKKCEEDDFVYCLEKYGANRPVVEEIFIRVGNEKRLLQGRARDEFVRERAWAGFNAQLKAVRDSVAAAGTAANGADAVLSSVRELLAKLDDQHIRGKVIVSGGHPFTEEAVTAAKKPKALAWEGQHYAEVSGWQGLVQKVLEKLQEINAAKFDELAGSAEFRKQLVTIQKPREKHGDCYPVKFGTEGKVRVKKSLGNKVYLWQEDKALRKLIAAFGVDVAKFMFVAG